MKKYIPIILTMIIWGSMGIPSTYAVKEFSPLAVLCFRSGIAAALLFIIMKVGHKSVRPAKKEFGLLIVLSIIGVVLCNYFYFYAVAHTTLTNVAIIYGLGPVLTTVLAALFLKEKVYMSRGIGIIIAFAGVFILVSGGNIKTIISAGFSKGDAAQFISSLCLAVYTVISKKIKRTSADKVVFWLMAIGFTVTLPMVLIMEGKIYFNASTNAIFSLVYLGVMCSGAGYLLQQQSIKKIGAASSSAFLNGISPITIITAAAVLGEKITPVQIMCMIAVFFGLFLNAINRGIRKKYR